jgi:hypothetical protein
MTGVYAQSEASDEADGIIITMGTADWYGSGLGMLVDIEYVKKQHIKTAIPLPPIASVEIAEVPHQPT